MQRGACLDALAQERRTDAQYQRALEESERLRADIVLVTATATEREELIEALATRSTSVEKIKGRGLQYRRALVGTWQVAAIHVEIGLFREGGALRRCQIARHETQAELFVSVGTAFGLPSRAALGDVLLSEAVLFYDDRRVIEDNGEIVEHIRSDAESADRFWVERVREVAALMASPRLVPGTLLSGGAIIESSSYRERLVRWHAPRAPSPIVGGEMEAAALVYAAGSQKWLLVKGVSDMADGATRGDEAVFRERQRSASRSAAIVILETLAQTERELKR